MNKSIAAAAVAASLAFGGLAGTVFGGPTLAGAAETATGAAGWVADALSALVAKGTITQDQADAVGSALEDARPERPAGHRGGGPHAAVVAEALGMTGDELRAALQDGRTIAEVAASRSVDVATVIDAIVAEHRDRLAEAVAAGDLTQARADEMLAGAAERATALVNGDMPAFGGRHGHGGPRFGPPPAGDGTAAATTTTDA